MQRTGNFGSQNEMQLVALRSIFQSDVYMPHHLYISTSAGIFVPNFIFKLMLKTYVIVFFCRLTLSVGGLFVFYCGHQLYISSDRLLQIIAAQLGYK